MKSARSAKHIILGLLILAVLLLGGWYFLYPDSLSSPLDQDEPISLSVNTAGVTVTGKATVDTVTYTFQPGSQEYQALISLLDGYAYHRNLLSLMPLEHYDLDLDTTSFVLQNGNSSFQLTDTGGFSITPAEKDASIRVFSVGYLGKDKAQQLSTALRGLLKSCTPTETGEELQTETP